MMPKGNSPLYHTRPYFRRHHQNINNKHIEFLHYKTITKLSRREMHNDGGNQTKSISIIFATKNANCREKREQFSH